MRHGNSQENIKFTWCYIVSLPKLFCKGTTHGVHQLFFTPSRWWWTEVTPFLEYSTKLGWKWITTQEDLKKPIPEK